MTDAVYFTEIYPFLKILFLESEKAQTIIRSHMTKISYVLEAPICFERKIYSLLATKSSKEYFYNLFLFKVVLLRVVLHKRRK